MKVKVGELRKFFRENFEQFLKDESVNRLDRARDGYGETEFEESTEEVEAVVEGADEDVEESVNRLNRAEAGYGETEFEEDVEKELPKTESLSLKNYLKIFESSDMVDMAKVQDMVGQTTIGSAKAQLARAQQKGNMQQTAFWAKVVELQGDLVAQGMRDPNEQ
jgi:hypothetical protein